jgi:uncharacterized membrane protein YcjF (UPF0283 family)
MPIPHKKASEFQTEEKQGLDVDPEQSTSKVPVSEVPPLSSEASTFLRQERFRKPPEAFQILTVPEDIAFLDVSERVLALDNIPRQHKKRFFFWLVLVSVGLALIMGVEVFASLWALYIDHPVLGVAFLLGWLCLGGGIVYWVVRTWRRFQKLWANTKAKELFQQAENTASAMALSDWLQQYFQERWKQGMLSHEHYAQTKTWLCQPGFYQNTNAITAAFAPLDQAARERVAEVALAAGVATAISQRAWLDMLLIFGKSCYLIPAIAEIYGARPGPLLTAHLFWKSLRIGLFAGVFDTVGDHLALLLTKASGDIPLVGAAANMATQGLVNATLVCRLGLACIQECRPIPLDRASLLSLYTSIFREKVTLKKIYMMLKAKESPV